MHRILVDIVQPYVVLHVLTALAIASLWRKRQETRRRLVVLTVLFASLVVLSLPPVGFLALGTLEWRYPPLAQRPADADVIVVLSGYVVRTDEYHPRPVLAVDTLYRCLRALDVYRQGPSLPIVVSGGKVEPQTPGPPLARVMSDFLVEMGVRPSDVIREERSTSTYENAVESCKILAARGFRRPILVTDGTHMARAVGCFRKLGVEVIPAACRYRASRFTVRVSSFLPSPGGAAGVAEAFHGWLGIAWYRLNGRL
jgi:uncharacterized SAM-binding protein YcdF (DUF218 family)